MDQFERSELLLRQEGIHQLKKSKVIVFGIGGVGGYVVEALARTGVGTIAIVDHDTVSLTNINRQIIATYDTLDQKKVDVMEKRILSINPQCIVEKYDMFFLPENKDLIDLTQYDYIVDAIDTVTAKILLVEIASENNIKIISSMGTGNKLDPTQLEIADITKTSVCPLARVMRRELKKRNIKHLKVLYSKEKPVETTNKTVPGSVAFVPSVAGLIIAGTVIKDLTGIS